MGKRQGGNEMKTKTVWYLFFLVMLALSLGAPHNILGQTQGEEASPSEVSNSTPAPKIDGRTTQMKKVELAGEKIGESVEAFSKKASSHFGGWFNVKVFAGITWLKLGICLVLLFLVVALERTLRWIIQARLRKMPRAEEITSVKELFLAAISKPISLFVLTYGIYGALTPLFVHFQTLEGDNLVRTVAQKAADIAGAFAILWFIYRLVAIVDMRLKRWAASTESTLDDVLVPLVGKTLRLFIVIIGSIIIIQNLTGVKIGPLLASLGIGGLAVALAARDSIANFFGTFTILFDKPFQVGERIVIDQYDGVVESVGFRSTRVRTLTGHLVSIPNEKVVNSTLENIGRRPHIRWLTNLTITYDTPPEKVEKAVQIILETLENHEGMHEDFPPRACFNGFNDWSLNILVVAWYHPPDYWAYNAWLQKTCLEIMRRFEAEGIEFAFPTRTVYVANDDKRQLKMQMLGEKAFS